MSIRKTRLNHPWVLRREARGITSLPSLLLLIGICLAPNFAGAQPPPFPYSGNVAPIILDDPLTHGMRLDTHFGLTVTVPSAPERVVIYPDFIALKYVSGAIIALHRLNQSAFELTDDQPSLHAIFTHFFSGKALALNNLDSSAARFIDGFFNGLRSDPEGNVLRWQEDTFDVYMYTVFHRYTLSDGNACVALVLDTLDKATVTKISVTDGTIESTARNAEQARFSCDLLKSIVATIRGTRD